MADKFHNLTSLEDDTCYLTERQRQNTEYSNYNTTNYFSQNCGLQNPMEVATNQPYMFINGGYGNVGAGGCNVNNDSQLRIGGVQNRSACRISLYTRPFATVPYLGRGPQRVLEEAKIQQGEYITNNKSCNTTTEMSHIPYRNYPLIPSLKSTVTNPHNLIEGAAAEGWIRGGLPTRDLIRDSDYIQRHGEVN